MRAELGEKFRRLRAFAFAMHQRKLRVEERAVVRHGQAPGSSEAAPPALLGCRRAPAVPAFQARPEVRPRCADGKRAAEGAQRRAGPAGLHREVRRRPAGAARVGEQAEKNLRHMRAVEQRGVGHGRSGGQPVERALGVFAGALQLAEPEERDRRAGVKRGAREHVPARQFIGAELRERRRRAVHGQQRMGLQNRRPAQRLRVLAPRRRALQLRRQRPRRREFAMVKVQVKHVQETLLQPASVTEPPECLHRRIEPLARFVEAPAPVEKDAHKLLRIGARDRAVGLRQHPLGEVKIEVAERGRRQRAGEDHHAGIHLRELRRRAQRLREIEPVDDVEDRGRQVVRKIRDLAELIVRLDGLDEQLRRSHAARRAPAPAQPVPDLPRRRRGQREHFHPQRRGHRMPENPHGLREPAPAFLDAPEVMMRLADLPVPAPESQRRRALRGAARELDGLCEKVDGLAVRVAPQRLVAREIEVVDGARGRGRMAPVVGEHGVVRAVLLLDETGQPAMQLLPLRKEQLLVGDLLDDVVLEGESRAAVGLGALRESERDQPFEARGEMRVVVRHGMNREQRAQGKGAAVDAGDLDGQTLAGRKAVDALADHALHIGGKTQAPQIAHAGRECAASVGDDEVPGVAQRVGQLLGKEGMALRLFADETRDRRGQRVHVEPPPDQRQHFFPGQRAERDAVAAGGFAQRRPRLRHGRIQRTRGEHEEQPRHFALHLQGQRQRGRVRPVRVLDHDDERLRRGRAGEKLHEHPGRRLGAGTSGHFRGDLILREMQAERGIEQRGEPRGLGVAGEKMPQQPGALGFVGVRRKAAHIGKDAAPRVVAVGARQRIAAAGEHAQPRLRGHRAELGDERGFPDPGLALDDDDAGLAARVQGGEPLAQNRALAFPPDDALVRRERRRGFAERPVNRHRAGFAFKLRRAQKLEADAARGGLPRGLVAEHIVFRQSHEPRAAVHGVADHGIRAPPLAADGAAEKPPGGHADG